MSTDFFSHKASSYEHDDKRVANVDNIARSILDNIQFDKTMHIMDFGSGTGLLLERIAPFVGKVTAVDISIAMNQQLESKKDQLPCQLNILNIDLETEDIDQKFHGIVSSMTMHHIKDVKNMLSKLYAMLEPKGFIAISDLDQEDGSFHKEDTGVYHHGFDRETFRQSAIEVGFSDVDIISASTVHKAHGSYPVFLLTGIKL